MKIFRSDNYPETSGMLVSIRKTGKQKHHLPVHQEVVLWPIRTNRLVLELEQMPNHTTTLMVKQKSSSTKKRKTPPIAAATGGASYVRKTNYSLIFSKCLIMLSCLNATDSCASENEKSTTPFEQSR